MDLKLIIISLCLLSFVIVYGVALWYISAMTGSNDDWNNVNNQVSLISGLTILGGGFFSLGVTVACASFVSTMYTAYAAIFLSIYATSLAIGAVAMGAMIKAAN